MRRVITLIGLQIYAIVLAAFQMRAGVRTDEAKYLLDIPYPHPPVGRFLFHLTESWSMQEAFLRVVLATLLVQAVWLVWSMGKPLPIRDRVAVCGVWLLSAGFVYQAGTLMMVSLTALQGLVLVWLYLRRDIDVTRFVASLSMFWMVALFTAFQAMLYLPLVIALIARSRIPLRLRIFCIVAPIVLVLVYIAGHPLLAASFVLVRGDNAGVSVAVRLLQVFIVWGIAGSVWGSILGIAGILSRRPGALFWTLFLLSAYILVSGHEYYAILFLPIFLAGLTLFLRRIPIPPSIVLTPIFIGTLLFFTQLRPPSVPVPARSVMQAIESRAASGTVLIAGPFGHEWQYESSLDIRRYRPEFMKDAGSVVCMEECPEKLKTQQHPSAGAGLRWIMMRGLPVEVWVKR